MPADAMIKPKYAPPSADRSFLALPGTFEYLLTGQTGRLRLADEMLGGAAASARNVILILIDGWGWRKAFDDSLPFVSRISKNAGTLIRQMDSAFPTTTAAMLPSLYLGESPTVHGYVEWRHYEESLGAMINVLPWRLDSDHGQRESLARRGVDPTTILKRGTFFRELKDKGVAGHLVQPHELQDSTFNSFIVPKEDATTVYYNNLRKGLDQVTAALAGPGERKLILLYAMKYDHICHLLGPESAGAKEALVQTLNEIDDWYLGVAGQHPGTLLTLTADHGQIHVPLTQWINLPEKAPLLGKYLRKDAAGGVVPMAGSARDRFAYLTPGTEAEAREVVARQLDGLADVMLVREMVERGYYGGATPGERFWRRMGDLCILPHAGCITGWDGAVGKDLGHHGGLSADEVQIPWVMTGLD
jgi:hypothetical protein